VSNWHHSTGSIVEKKDKMNIIRLVIKMLEAVFIEAIAILAFTVVAMVFFIVIGVASMLGGLMTVQESDVFSYVIGHALGPMIVFAIEYVIIYAIVATIVGIIVGIFGILRK